MNIANAARTARDNIGNYEQSGAGSAAPATVKSPDAAQPASAPTAIPRAAVSGAATGSPAASEKEVEGAATTDGQGREAAAQLLRTYHRLIAQGRFDDAWALWDREGQASGMSREAFAASFAKYRTYNAVLGAPGRIDAGAGQRYVTLPVTVTGALRDGGTFELSGPMVLHRAGPIDGATPEQRSWRIYQSDLKPQPSSPGAADQVATRFVCDDGTTFRARFDNRANDVLLSSPNGRIRLVGQPVASGMHYAGKGYDLRGKGSTVTLSRSGHTDVQCREIK